ncbi:MAG: class I SAM-dependent methyltransferase [Gammaproteobacteria bacterium]
MHVSTDLPEPDADALAHSGRVAALIRERIEAAGGWVDFADYMDLALYAPGLGYYSAGSVKLGAAGDFVTAPEVSGLFSRCVARAVAPVIGRGAGQVVLELGAGTGAMAAGVLQALADEHALPARYRILEVSADLRERQQRTLRERIPALLPLVEWLDTLPGAIDGVILANEVADALPVSRFRIGAGRERVCELGVVADGDSFRWASRTAPDALCEAVGVVETGIGSPLPPGYVSEIGMRVPALVGSLRAALNDGACLLIDYGLPRRELYSRQRREGTLICHYRHRAHADPFLFPGLQDITAWVDFTALAEAAVAAGLRVDGFMTQARFLMAAGLESEFLAAGARNPDSRLALSRETQTLLLPGEMGEKFKVMWLGKGAAMPGARFAPHDQRHRL